MYEKTIKHDGKYITVSISPDQFPLHPRKEWDNLGVLVMTHKRYTFPNEANIDFDAYNSWGEVQQKLEEKYQFVFPVYMYEHSGIAFSINPFGDRFDSGQVGFICFDSKDFTPLDADYPSIVVDFAKQELQTYEYYVEGEVYRADIHEGAYMDEELIDGMGNYFGPVRESGLLEELESTITRLYGEEACSQFEFDKL